MRKKKESLNFLDCVPCRLAESTAEEGRVSVRLIHRGFFSWVAAKFFHRPKESIITLDDLGSYVWGQMDGKRDIHALGLKVSRRFGEKAEPLYERLVQFCRILHQNGMITLTLIDKKDGLL